MKQIYSGELPWGMLLLCESEGNKPIFPSELEIREAVKNNKSIINKLNMAYILTESHVDGKNVEVYLVDGDIATETGEEIEVVTQSSKLYIGNIPKDQFVIVNSPNNKFNLEVYITQDTNTIKIYLSIFGSYSITSAHPDDL